METEKKAPLRVLEAKNKQYWMRMTMMHKLPHLTMVLQRMPIKHQWL